MEFKTKFKVGQVVGNLNGRVFGKITHIRVYFNLNKNEELTVQYAFSCHSNYEEESDLIEYKPIEVSNV